MSKENLTSEEDDGRMYGLDLLRALAITSVVFFHYPASGALMLPVRHYGWIGVDLFFVLSGYLIGGQLFSQMVKQGKFSLKQFYARRFLRTLPNYYVMLALYFFVPRIREGAAAPAAWRYIFFTQNFGAPQIFKVTWSLCIEEHFYLLFPILVIILVRINKPGVIGAFIILLILCGVILRSFIWMDAAPDIHFDNPAEVWGVYLSRIFRPTYNRLDGLTLGVALAAVRCFRPHYWARLMTRGNALFAAGLGGLFASTLVLLHQLTLISCALGFPLLAISFALITASSISRNCGLCKFKLPGVQFIARLSYALYLVHPIAISCALWFSRQTDGQVSHGIMFPVTILLCLSLAGILHYVVERPFLKIRDNLFPNRENAKRPLTPLQSGGNAPLRA